MVKKWNCQLHGVRQGSANANAGGWKNGKMTAGSIIEAPDNDFKFSFPSAEPLGALGNVLQMDEVAFGYSNQKLFSNVNLSLNMNSRVVILGDNGSGKSTLLNLIMGNLTPINGEIWRHHNLKIGYFNQHYVDQLDVSLSPLEHMVKTFQNVQGDKEKVFRSHLGSFGLSGGLALQKIGTLSGGQKSRVIFAAITFLTPHMLILDEPTNHLDFNTIQAFIDALTAFEGPIIVVTHDQSLIYEIENIGGELYVVRKGSVKKFDSTFDDYKVQVLKIT